jgi:hypothetical protein
MKLTAGTGTYTPTIETDTNGSFANYHVIPSTYTKVATFNSTTDATNGSTLTGNTPAVNSRVFLQDYVTKANFTIKAGSAGVTNNTGLGNAYGVIPDLTSPTMELGMSVDLTWQAGITFTLDM